MHLVLNWLYHVFGISGTGAWYGFWSGAGADFTELSILGGLIAVYRKNNCEIHRCWRLGKHTTAAGHSTCRKHHPDDHLTHEQVIAEHEIAIERRNQ